MIRFLHALTGTAFAMLLELFTGNRGWVIPFCACVLTRVTEKMALPWAVLLAFCTGTVFDLIFWRQIPAAGLTTALTVLGVRLIMDRSKLRNSFLRALFTGALTGLFALLLMTVFQGYADGTRLPRKIHLFTAVAGGAVFRLLIAPLGKKENTPAERNTPPGKSGEEKSPSSRKRTAKSGKSTGKKKA